MTGKAPGNPKHTGQVFELGSSPKRVEQPQNIFDSVLSWAWISSPITASYLSLIDVSIGGLIESIASGSDQLPRRLGGRIAAALSFNLAASVEQGLW